MKGYTYPRSLTEAFNDADRSFALYGPYRRYSLLPVLVAWIACVAVIIIGMVMQA